MRSSPGFSGKLGKYCDTSPGCRTVHYWIMGIVMSACSPVPSTKPCHVPSVRLESQRMAPKNKQLMAIVYSTSIVWQRTCFVWLPMDTASTHLPYEFLLSAFMPRIHFGKPKAAYRYHWLAHCISTQCSCTLQSYNNIWQNISPCYLWIQLTYVNELYTECNGTARECTDSGYKALLSDFCECLGTRIIQGI